MLVNIRSKTVLSVLINPAVARAWTYSVARAATSAGPPDLVFATIRDAPPAAPWTLYASVQPSQGPGSSSPRISRRRGEQTWLSIPALYDKPKAWRAPQ